jgi:hypothetical protein
MTLAFASGPGAAPAAPVPETPRAVAVWQAAAAALPTPVFRPTGLAGFRLARFQIRGRGTPNPMVDAVYGRADGAYLRLLEGGPRCCGEGGDAPMLARPALPGGRGRLYAYGEGPHADEGGLTLYFNRGGAEIALVTSRLTADELLSVARGMRKTPDPARP